VARRALGSSDRIGTSPLTTSNLMTISAAHVVGKGYLEIITEPQQGLITLEVGQVERTCFIVRVACDLSIPSG